MASREPIEDSLHNLLNCKLCQKEVDELKALPCQHTICLSCAKQLPIFKNRFNCSICHQEYPVPNGGFQHLPDSLVHKQLKDVIKPRAAKDSNFDTKAASQVENQSAYEIEMADGSKSGNKSAHETSPIIANGYVSSEKGTMETSKISQGKQKQTSPRNAEQVGRMSLFTSSATIVDRETLRKDLFGTLEMGKRWYQKADKMMTYYTGVLEDSSENAKNTEEEILEYQTKVRQQCQEKLKGLDKGLVQRTLTSKAILEALEPCASQMKTVLDSEPRDFIAWYEDISTENITEAHDSLQKLQAANKAVKELPFNVSDFGNLRKGDCVRLVTKDEYKGDWNVSTDSLFEHLMENKVTHASIGICRGNTFTKTGSKSKVIFPEKIDWMGPEKSVTKCPGKVNLPLEGEKVKVKPFILEPHFSWNGLKNKRSHGILKEIKDEGPENDLEVIVNFPENNSWKGLYSEITLASSCGLEIGDEVWVSRVIPEPSRGWAGVNGSSVGKIMHIEGDEGQEEVTVDFPECKVWIGWATELEMVREPQKGEKVQVKLSLTEPRFGWGGASHDVVGDLEEIADEFNEFGRIGYVRFPGKPRCPFVIGDLEPARYQAPIYEDNSGHFFLVVNLTDVSDQDSDDGYAYSSDHEYYPDYDYGDHYGGPGNSGCYAYGSSD